MKHVFANADDTLEVIHAYDLPEKSDNLLAGSIYRAHDNSQAPFINQALGLMLTANDGWPFSGYFNTL